MNLHVVAYPDLSPASYEQIQRYRRDHNSLYKVIAPHFTIVFSVPDMPQDLFVQEIRKQLEHTAGIDFCLRCATVNKDAFSNNYDAFLVPDEGFGAITRLHDRLYSDQLAPYHLLDISYIPHLSIANDPDVYAIKAIVDQWNKQDFAISGTISSLDIINYEHRIVTTVEKIALRK